CHSLLIHLLLPLLLPQSFFSFSMLLRPPTPTLFPYTTLFRSDPRTMKPVYVPTNPHEKAMQRALIQYRNPKNYMLVHEALVKARSEEHTSELQSRFDLVCRLLLEKKNTTPHG